MIRSLILLVCMIQLSDANTISLKELLASTEKNNTLMQAIMHESLALEAKNLASSASEPSELYGSLAKAKPDLAPKADEYSIGISKQIKFGHAQELEQHIARFQNQAYVLDEEKRVLNFTNGVKDLYHQHCMDKENYLDLKAAYGEFDALFKKKQKAFELQEISKLELVQLQMEKEKLFGEFQRAEMIQNLSKANLFRLSRHNRAHHVSCADVYRIKKSVILPKERFSITKQAYEKRIASTHASLQRHSMPLDSVNLSMQYDKELDIDRYTVGISVPLNFTSRKSEQERVAAMHENSAISFRYEQEMLEKNVLFDKLEAELIGAASTISTLRANLEGHKNTLLPLVYKSYTAGEVSALEYLLGRQQYHRLKQELYLEKKAYYHTLFELYSLSETKDNQ